MSPRLRSTVRQIAQKTSIKALVVDVQKDTATVRLSKGGHTLHSIPNLAGVIKVNDLVIVTYDNGAPRVSSRIGHSPEASVNRTTHPAVILQPPTPYTVASTALADQDTNIELLGLNGWTIDSGYVLTNASLVIDPAGIIKVLDDAELVAIFGDLNGTYGYATAIPGAAFGKYATDFPNITIDPTYGLRIRNYNVNIMEFNIEGEALITGSMSITGSLLAGNNSVKIDTQGIQIVQGGDNWNKIRWSNAEFSGVIGEISASPNHFEITSNPTLVDENSYMNIVCKGGASAGNSSLMIGAFDPYLLQYASITMTSLFNSTKRVTIGGPINTVLTGIYGGLYIGNAAATATPSNGNLDMEGAIRLDGGIYIGNKAGTTYTDDLVVDGGIHAGGSVTDPGVGIITAQYTLKALGDGSSYGIFLGTDAQLYRSAANVLRTPDDFWIDLDARITGGLYVGGQGVDPASGVISALYSVKALGDGSSYGIFIGTDTQLYRQAANVIRTPDDFWGDADIRLTGGIYLGGQANDPGAGNLDATGTIRLGGGLSVGDSTLSTPSGDIIVAGGVYIGGSGIVADPTAGTLYVRYSTRTGSCFVAGDCTQSPPASSIMLMIKEQDSQGAVTSGYGGLYAMTEGWPVWLNDQTVKVPMHIYRVELGIGSAVLPTGTEYTTISTYTRAIGFDNDATDTADWTFKLPRGWASSNVAPKLILWWAPGTASTGNVVWIIQQRKLHDGSVVSSSVDISNSAVLAISDAADKIKRSVITLSTYNGVMVEGDAVAFRIYRDGANGSDTYGGTAKLAAAAISMAENI